jgi:hypothetical protein
MELAVLLRAEMQLQAQVLVVVVEEMVGAGQGAVA